MLLETERLILRPGAAEDAPALFEYAGDPQVGPAAGWPAHKSVDASRRVIAGVFNGPECYALCPKPDGTPAGCVELKLCGATDATDRADECEFGCWIGRPFWGRGLVPEAARALIRRAFTELGMSAVWYRYYDGNEKSRRVCEKLGFVWQRTSAGVPAPLINAVKTEHACVLTRERWMTL